MNCYTHYLEVSISETHDKKFADTLTNEVERVKKESFEAHQREVDRLKEQARTNELLLKDQINRLSKEIEEKDSKVLSLTLNNSESQELENNQNDLVANYVKKLRTLELENEELKKSKLASTNQTEPKPATYQAFAKKGCLESCSLL